MLLALWTWRTGEWKQPSVVSGKIKARRRISRVALLPIPESLQKLDDQQRSFQADQHIALLLSVGLL